MSRYSLVVLALIGAVLLATSQVTAQSFARLPVLHRRLCALRRLDMHADRWDD